MMPSSCFICTVSIQVSMCGAPHVQDLALTSVLTSKLHIFQDMGQPEILRTLHCQSWRQDYCHFSSQHALPLFLLSHVQRILQ